MDAAEDIFDHDEAGHIAIPVSAVLGESELQTALKNLADSGKAVINYLSHSSPPDSGTQGILLVEIRLMEAFEDLALIRRWREKRPLQPIIGLCSNDDEDFVLEAYKAGVDAFLLSHVPAAILAENLRIFHKLSEAPRLVEIQNETMMKSMEAERQATESKLRAESEKKVAEAAAAANRRTREILDNLSSGFFIIESDLKIADTTSQSCLEIFKKDIASQKLGSALNLAGDAETYLLGAVEQVFDDFMPLSVNMNLLPKRVRTKDERVIGFIYHPVLDAANKPVKLIIEASDLSDMVREQEKANETQRMNEALLRILGDREAFHEFLVEAKEDIAKLHDNPGIETGRRILHTLKGNSAVMGLEAVAHAIHIREDELGACPPEAVPAFLNESADLIEAEFRNFLKAHKTILQMNWDEGAHFTLNEAEVNFLSAFAQKTKAAGRQTVLKILERAKLRPIKSLLSGFDTLAKRIGDRSGKQIRFVLVGGHQRLDPHHFGHLMKSFVHALRNACDHGIETIEERERIGKPAQGTILFKFERDETNGISITLQDDGRGIAVAKLVRKAVERKILNAESAKALKREEALKLIFADGLSTADSVSETSGRGVGMSCIRSEVEALGGELRILSKEGVGTVCKIRIPPAA